METGLNSRHRLEMARRRAVRRRRLTSAAWGLLIGIGLAITAVFLLVMLSGCDDALIDDHCAELLEHEIGDQP
jgi:ABC-type lipoprotein release transport system permease subunit